MLRRKGIERKALPDLVFRALHKVPSRDGVQDRVVAHFNKQRLNQLDDLAGAGYFLGKVHHFSRQRTERQNPQRFKKRPLREALVPEHLGPAGMFLQHIEDVLQ